MMYRSTKSRSLVNEFKDNRRFTVETNDVVNQLNISDLQLSDSATYYCSNGNIYVFEFMEVVTVSVKGSGPPVLWLSADEVDWLVVFLSATSAITTLLSVLLAFSICMMRVPGKCYYLFLMIPVIII